MGNANGAERLFRIVGVTKRGTESVLEPCLPELETTGFLRVFNSASHITGRHAIARELESPCIKRYGACELQ